MAVPRFAVLKIERTGQYLCYRREESVPHLGFIVQSKEEVVSPFVKVELEPAKTDHGLVNIRFCHNNRYWVPRSETDCQIVAGADEPDEDRSKWSCTLFQPLPYKTQDKEDGQYIHLRHVRFNAYAGFDSSYMSAKPNDKYTPHDNVFKVIDWESLVILPKHVTFKGDNGKYLGVCWLRDNQPFLQFSFTDAADQAVRHEAFIVGDGMIRIKAYKTGKYWRSSPCWIWADSTDDSSEVHNDTSNLFWPVKVGPNIIALRHIGLNRFCKRLTDYWESCLNAAVPSITSEARLVVEEPVL